MLREKLIDHRFGENNKFRRRSHEISRIEGLSDAVFSFVVFRQSIDGRTWRGAAGEWQCRVDGCAGTALVSDDGLRRRLRRCICGVYGVNGTIMGRRRRRLEKQIASGFEVEPNEVSS